MLMHKSVDIGKEWDEASEPWVDFVRRGKDYFRDELNNPAFFKLIGEVKGKAILDLACGEGYNSRILAKKGGKVIGIDISEKLIEFARQEEVRKRLKIRYYVMDACRIGFPENSFDLITCFMALQDIWNFEKAISQVARVLNNGGKFIFSIPHPCFETMTVNVRRINATERYFGVVRHHIQWDMKRLANQFTTTAFHRTLTDYSNALYKNKLFISRFIEPKPTPRGLRKYPPLRKILLRPQSIVIESVKLA
jgi:ubiquinone/menaquinone biosynthesis C-methylase UbiE